MKIPASYPKVTTEDKNILLQVVNKGWFTESNYCKKFVGELCKVSRAKHALLVNSGSSADFIAVKTMTDYFPGKYIITCATGFPTTVAPIYQHGKIPVYVDIDVETLSPNMGQIDYVVDQYGADIAGAILTHTLGFPFDEALVREILGEDRFLISDACDCLGGEVRERPVGSWSDMTTYSFFPAHHIFSGEGGAITTNDDKFTKKAFKYINWGRDCNCLPGQSNVCGKRFEYRWDKLPDNFDHKYTFTELGYNLKMTEFQGALGYSQILRLESIVQKRRVNYLRLWLKLKEFSAYLNFVIADNENINPSPFGFPVIVKKKWEHIFNPLIRYLEENGISTRRMFGGNLIRQPAFQNLPYLRVPDLDGADIMLERTFWIGCHPSIEWEGIVYIYDIFQKFFNERKLF